MNIGRFQQSARQRATTPASSPEPEKFPVELLLQAEIVSQSAYSQDGAIVKATAIPWFSLLELFKSNPDRLFEFSSYPRKFEEFIAGAYDAAGFDEVVLTPRSGDRGRDVIATKHGVGSVRFLDQTKAYSSGHLVTADDVRSMLGVLSTDTNSSKGLITTTSNFAPSVLTSGELTVSYPIDWN